jgi:hypothetical protein
MSTNVCNICNGPSTKAYLEKNKMCGTCFAKVKKTIAKKSTKAKCPVCNLDVKSNEIDENGICKTCNNVISSIQTETKEEGKQTKTKKSVKKTKVADIIPSEILSDINIDIIQTAKNETPELVNPEINNTEPAPNTDLSLNTDTISENNIPGEEPYVNNGIKDKINQIRQMLAELESMLQ